MLRESVGSVDEVDRGVRSIFTSVLKVQGESLDTDTLLIEDLSVDSLDALDLVVKIQDVFNLELSEQEFSRFTTFGQVVACVREAILRGAVRAEAL
jgi:acyl carrier protein